MKNTYNQAKLMENIDCIAKYDFDNKKVFGSAYYVYNDGQILQKCYGNMSLQDTPITDTTIFRLASMTKPVTAVAALILVDKGLLSLEDRVDKYLPAFKDILIKAADCGINITYTTAKTNKEKGIGIIELGVEVKGIDNLNAVITAFQSLPDVHSVKRIQMNSKVKMSTGDKPKTKQKNRK